VILVRLLIMKPDKRVRQLDVTQKQMDRIKKGQILRNMSFVRCKVSKSNLDYAPAQKY